MDCSVYCRLCAKTDKKPLIPVLDNNTLNLKEKLQKLLHIEVFERTKLPKTICLDCLTKLNQFNEFFTTSRENQVILGIIFGESHELQTKRDSDSKLTPEESSDKNIVIIEEYSIEQQEDSGSANEEKAEHDFEIFDLALNENDESQVEIDGASSPKKKKFDRFDCYVCNEQLPGNNKFVQHFKENHPAEEIRYTCFVCQNSVTKYRSYTRHIESHAEKRFNCDVCDRTFSQKITLVQHLNSHSNIKAYKCDDCGLNFKQNSSLFKHRKQKHSRIVLTCSECDKSFVNNETLQQHMRSKHNAEKEISCQDCLKAFASRSALMYHRSSHHTGNTQEHSCKICNKKFRTLVILSRHMKKFHILS